MHVFIYITEEVVAHSLRHLHISISRKLSLHVSPSSTPPGERRTGRKSDPDRFPARDRGEQNQRRKPAGRCGNSGWAPAVQRSRRAARRSRDQLCQELWHLSTSKLRLTGNALRYSMPQKRPPEQQQRRYRLNVLY